MSAAPHRRPHPEPAVAADRPLDLSTTLVRGEIEEDDSAVATMQAADDIRLERSAAPLKRIDPVVICDARQAVLPTDELPPPSIPLVAYRFGHTYANLHRDVSELRRAAILVIR